MQDTPCRLEDYEEKMNKCSKVMQPVQKGESNK